MSFKLFAPYTNPRARLILIASELAGVKVDHQLVEYSETKTPEHLARNPVGKVPVI